MRLSLILLVLLVLLASADALAQGAPKIVTPTKDGVAEGVSTYTAADGTRVEITWHDGRKHGPFRKVTQDGVVLETFASRRRLALKSLEIRMRNGDTILSELRGMSVSERPESFATKGYADLPSGWKDFKVMTADKLGCKQQRW